MSPCRWAVCSRLLLRCWIQFAVILTRFLAGSAAGVLAASSSIEVQRSLCLAPKRCTNFPDSILALLLSSKLEETAHQLSTLDIPAALFFARSAHHDVQALLQIGQIAGSVLHSQISCPQPDALEIIDFRMFFIGCMVASGFALVSRKFALPCASLRASCCFDTRYSACMPYS